MSHPVSHQVSNHNVSSKWLIKVSHQNISPKCLIKKSHQNVSSKCVIKCLIKMSADTDLEKGTTL